MKTNKPINPKKAQLIQLSQIVKAQMDMGIIEAETVNQGLIEMYFENSEVPELSTFGGWKKQGFKVKKGEKSTVIIWGKPRKATKKTETKNGKDDESKYKYFPLAYLFTENQVEKFN